MPAVQTAAVNRVMERLVRHFDCGINASKVSFEPFNTLVIEDLCLLDHSPYQGDIDAPQDTVFFARSVTARFTLRGLISQSSIRLSRAKVTEARLSVVSEPGEYKSNIRRVFKLEVKDEEQSDKELLSIGRVSVQDFTYRMINYRKPASPTVKGVINWKDLEAVANIEGRHLSVRGPVISGIVDRATVSEKSGILLTELSGKARGGRGEVHIEDLHISDNESDLNFSDFRLLYADKYAFSDFLHEVSFDASFLQSRLAFTTTAYFAPALHSNPIVAEISSGEVRGPVSGLDISGLNFLDSVNGVKVMADVRLIGLPDITETKLDAHINGLTFTTSGLGSFISCWTRGESTDLGKFAKDEDFVFSGHARGAMSDLAVSGGLHSSAGDADADIRINNLLTDGDITINGSLGTDDIDIGKIIGKDFVGELSLKTGLEAVIGDQGLSLKVDSLSVDRLNILGYDYSGIKAAGTFSERAFNGRIVCNDPNINFMFQGLFNLSRRTNNAEYRFFAYLGYADLHALNIDSREVSRVSLGSVNANYTRITRGDLVGSIDATDLIFESAAGRHKIGDFHISSSSSDTHSSISLRSGFAHGQYNGSVPFISFVNGLQDVTVRRELPSLFSQSAGAWAGENCEVQLYFHDNRDLMSFIYPGAYIADSTSLRVSISSGGRLQGSIRSPRIALREKYIKGLEVRLNNHEDALNCSVTSDEISISRKIKLKNDALLLYADDNRVGVGFNYNNMTEPESRGELYLTGDTKDSTPGAVALSAKSLTSNIYYKGEQWRFDPAEYAYEDKSFKINNLSIKNGDQEVMLSGGVSPVGRDTLSLSLSNIDLSILDSFMSRSLNISGTTSGRMLLASPTEDHLELLMNLASENTRISGREAGTVRIASNWDNANGRLNLIARNEMDGERGFELRGYYSPLDKSVNLNAELNKMDFGYAGQFLSSVFDGVDGTLKGRLTAEGPLKRLNLSSENLTLTDGLLTVGYTKVPYRLNGPLSVDNTGVHFHNMEIRDSGSGSGVLSGGIAFDRLQNIRMATHIRMEDIECLRTGIIDNDSFYGHVYGTGRMSITGPFNSLLLDLDATTTRNGDFHIPLGGSSSLSTHKLLTFKEHQRIEYIDPYEQMMSSLNARGQSSNDMGIKLRVNAQQGVEACLDMSGNAEISMRARGSGIINLDIRPSKDIFAINGDYTLSSGNCHVSAFGVANKEFSVLEGSSIKFNGDIMDSDLDLDARYNVKTSLATLISDTTSVSTRRNVECGIRISDKLRNPKLDFSINVPDLDPTTKSRVESALSTDDKIQKQFVALLVTNNFIPDEQSGIVNNSNILYSNVADIMANQLNSILQKLDIPLDLGLNFQSNDSGTNIFDVALSTQLFNNRVIVNGNIGNRQYMSSSEEDVVGDLDIEIKMDKSGQFRLNLFSHSADQYTNYLDNSQRNGVGLTYQKEFNSLREFLKHLFTTKEKRRQLELERDTAADEKVVISIE